ncbi:MAG: DUF5686 family protein, partial [Saprospiraceae bacterium]
RVSMSYSKEFSRWGELILIVKYNKLFGKSIEVADAIFPTSKPITIYDLDNGVGFKVLKPYQRIGMDQLFEIHIQQNLKGLILDRIPFLNRLGFTEILSYSYLTNTENTPYTELAIGLGNIGFGTFRYLRIDWVKVLNGGTFGHSYLRVGINNILQLGR